MLNLHLNSQEHPGRGPLPPNWTWRFGTAGRLVQWLLCLVVLTTIGCEQSLPKPRQEHILREALWPIAFSPDGKRLLTRSLADDGMVKVWDPCTGKELSEFSGPTINYQDPRTGEPFSERLSIGAFDLSPKGTLAASVGRDRQVPPPPLPISPKEVEIRLREGYVVLLWDTVTGKVVRSVPVGVPGERAAFSFSSDGKLVAISDALERVRLIDVETGKVLPSPQFPPLAANRPLYCLAFSPDGKRIACGNFAPGGGGKGAVTVWNLASDLASGEQVWERQIEREPTSLAYSPDGRLLAACNGSKNIHVWDAADGQHHFTLGSQNAREKKIAFHPNGRYLASTGDTATRIWDLRAKKMIHTLDHSPRHRADDIAYSSDGKWLATACGCDSNGHGDPFVIVWNLQSAKENK